MGRETAQLVATMRRLRETDPLGAARRAWVGFLPTTIPLSAAEARREIVRLGRRASASESLPAYPTAPARLLGASANGGARPTVVDAIRAAAKSSPRSPHRCSWPRRPIETEAVRRLSASEASLFTASLDRPLAEYRSLSELPEPPYAELRAGAQANALGAVAAIARRDYAEAERRLGRTRRSRSDSSQCRVDSRERSEQDCCRRRRFFRLPKSRTSAATLGRGSSFVERRIRCVFSCWTRHGAHGS